MGAGGEGGSWATGLEPKASQVWAFSDDKASKLSGSAESRRTRGVGYMERPVPEGFPFRKEESLYGHAWMWNGGAAVCCMGIVGGSLGMPERLESACKAVTAFLTIGGQGREIGCCALMIALVPLLLAFVSTTDAALSCRRPMHGTQRVTPLSPRMCAVAAVVFFIICVLQVPQLCRHALIHMQREEASSQPATAHGAPALSPSAVETSSLWAAASVGPWRFSQGKIFTTTANDTTTVSPSDAATLCWGTCDSAENMGLLAEGRLAERNKNESL